MMRRLLPRAARGATLAADQRGTSVIEFAFIAPILSLLTMGIIDISTGYGRRMELTQAASRTLERLAVDGFQVPGEDGNPDLETFKASVKATAAEAAGVAASQVTATLWLECDGVEQQPYDEKFNGTCEPADPAACDTATPPDDCSQVIARYVQVRIDDSFEPMFGAIYAPRADGTYPLWVEAAVRLQ